MTSGVASVFEPVVGVLDLPVSVLESRLRFLPRLLEADLSRWLGCLGEALQDWSRLLVLALPAARMAAEASADITLFMKIVKFSTLSPVLYRAARISGRIA